MKDQNRRDFLITTGATAAAAAFSRNTLTGSAFADPAPGTEWDYRATKETAAALRARKISATEPAGTVIGRFSRAGKNR